LTNHAIFGQQQMQTLLAKRGHSELPLLADVFHDEPKLSTDASNGLDYFTVLDRQLDIPSARHARLSDLDLSIRQYFLLPYFVPRD
jgi:hypothetical protein